MLLNRTLEHPVQEVGMLLQDAHLSIDPDAYASNYNETPFLFSHNLHTLDMMQFGSLCELAEKYDGCKSEYNIAGSAPNPGVFASPSSEMRRSLTPGAAIRMLDKMPLRLLLKRPEDCDPQFRALMDLLLDQIAHTPGGAQGQRIVRAQGSILISSAAAITPLHFDPEIGFFCQIEGGKDYHVYSPDDVAEDELERFYVQDQITTCRLDMKRRSPSREHLFRLKAGDGFHQPQNAPHWVQTCNTRSISYTVVFETVVSRACCRTRAFNFYERKMGLEPSTPGLYPQRDRLKAMVAVPERFIRKAAKRVLSPRG